MRNSLIAIISYTEADLLLKQVLLSEMDGEDVTELKMLFSDYKENYLENPFSFDTHLAKLLFESMAYNEIEEPAEE